MLPQVLAGLGALSIASAGCVLWLERFRPLFVLVAVAALAYQASLVLRRPPSRRSRRAWLILSLSVVATSGVLVAWLMLSLRYR